MVKMVKYCLNKNLKNQINGKKVIKIKEKKMNQKMILMNNLIPKQKVKIKIKK